LYGFVAHGSAAFIRAPATRLAVILLTKYRRRLRQPNDPGFANRRAIGNDWIMLSWLAPPSAKPWRQFLRVNELGLLPRLKASSQALAARRAKGAMG
jgi:hypothetical protein